MLKTIFYLYIYQNALIFSWVFNFLRCLCTCFDQEGSDELQKVPTTLVVCISFTWWTYWIKALKPGFEAPCLFAISGFHCLYCQQVKYIKETSNTWTVHWSKCQLTVTTPRDWMWTLLFPWPNDPAINRQLRWTSRNQSSCSEFISRKSVTSHKKHSNAKQGSTAWRFFAPNIPFTMSGEHKSDNETVSSRQSTPGVFVLVRKRVCKWRPWPKSNSRARSLIANYRPRHPNQRPFKEMISDSFWQSSEKYERARIKCKCPRYV